MPRTIKRSENQQVIGGTFATREDADKAVEAFKDAGVPTDDIQVIVQVNDKQSDDVYTDILTENGFADSQAHFYGSAVREGKVLVVIYNVMNPAEIIGLFDRFKAQYNPNGSRNLRDDVAGMTLGATVGAVAGSLTGAAIGGPLGAAAGGAVGVILGGGSGAAAGKAIEHNK